MSKDLEILQWIQEWYCNNCDGDWEHDKNFTIETLDNPGWSAFINVEGTYLEDKPFSAIDTERNESNWIYCIVEKNKFKSAGGPHNLIEILLTFKEWAENCKKSEGSS